ncbi:hypothetical protein IMY05_C4372001300 [Salix suchowensis]|nr:hypothetical protein IMY05_C4372001300 [Salix suchowensis]
MKRPRRPSSEVAAEKTKKIQKKAHMTNCEWESSTRLRGLNRQPNWLIRRTVISLPYRPLEGPNFTRPSTQGCSSNGLDTENFVPDSKEEHLREREQRNAEKKEAKRLARSLIEVERAAMNHGNVPVKIKRKADSHRFPAKKTKRKNPVGGLRDGWSIKDKVPPEASQAHIDNPDSDCEPIGGISDDDDISSYKEAWYNPTHADAYQSWLAVLARSEEGYGQPSEKHIAVAEKLINNHIAQIRNKTKEAAVKALDILLRNENKNSIEEKADYVKWLQGDGLYDNKPPFLYKRIENGKRKWRQRGTNPRDTLSHFSHSNWSDREETIIDDYGEPTTKLIPITSSIKSLVDQLSSEQWRKVIEEATQFTLKETDPLPSAAVSEYNENPKLVDDDEDLQPQPSSIDYDNPKSQSTTSSSGLTYDNSQSQPMAGSSHSANDDFQSQPSPGELGARPGTTYMTLITMT